MKSFNPVSIAYGVGLQGNFCSSSTKNNINNFNGISSTWGNSHRAILSNLLILDKSNFANNAIESKSYKYYNRFVL